MNTCASTVLLKPQKGETTLYITNMTKANVSIPRTIKWDEVTLPEKWVMDKATPSIPRPTPTIEQFKQDNSGKVEITFNRRNSFSSRIEASRQSEYKSTRRPFSVKTRSIPVGLSRSESQPVSRINLQGLDMTSRILRTTRWSFQHFKGLKRQQIQEKFYKFFERVKTNILFFDWFHAYTVKENIDYPWQPNIIGDPTSNVTTN
ncbi:hypothetical protein GmHk_06G017293 [Glycine max]|nr:hypothetical protein GmHk_06G017293 [Glycine max]